MPKRSDRVGGIIPAPTLCHPPSKGGWHTAGITGMYHSKTKPLCARGDTQRGAHPKTKPPLCKGGWRAVRRDGGIVSIYR